MSEKFDDNKYRTCDFCTGSDKYPIESGVELDGYGVCGICSEQIINCLKCSKANCIECNPGYYLWSESDPNGKSQCVACTDKGQIQTKNEEGKLLCVTCSRAIVNCKICTKGKVDCEECLPNSDGFPTYMVDLNDDGMVEACKNECPLEFFLEKTQSKYNKLNSIFIEKDVYIYFFFLYRKKMS